MSDHSLIVSISCLKSGETLHQFSVSSPERYKAIDHHFHVFTTKKPKEDSSFNGLMSDPAVAHQDLTNTRETSDINYGLSFAHEKVAERFYLAVMQLIPKRFLPQKSTKWEERLSHSLSLSTSLTVTPEEMTDLPPLVQSDSFLSQNFLIEEAGALTSSGRFPNPLEESVEDEQSLQVLQRNFSGIKSEEEIVEDVDAAEKYKMKLKGYRSIGQLCSGMALSKRRGSLDTSSEVLMSKSPILKRRSESMEDIRISYPTSVRHLAHVSQETPFHTLKQVINTGTAPGSVVESDIERQRFEKLKRTPSAPCRVRHRSSSMVKSTPPIIFVTPPDSATKSNKQLPKPPPPVQNFESLVQQLQTTGEIDKNSEFTNSTEAWQQSFHSAVGNLIRKKIYEDPLNSKLLSFTQSGREETSESSNSRTASLIIHDHGIVCL